MSEKEYEALERFSVYTVDGGLDDITAIKKVQKQFGRPIALKVWEMTKHNEQR